MFYPVQHHSPYSHLTGIGLASRLGGYEPGKKVYVVGPGGRRGVTQAQRRKSLGAHNAVGL
jgi:hypothetical protein